MVGWGGRAEGLFLLLLIAEGEVTALSLGMERSHTAPLIRVVCPIRRPQGPPWCNGTLLRSLRSRQPERLCNHQGTAALVESEIIHGRVAMLAVVGFIVGKNVEDSKVPACPMCQQRKSCERQ